MSIRVAVGQFKELTADDISFCRQLGVSGITVNRPDFDAPSWRAFLNKHYPYGPADFNQSETWDFMDLVNLRLRLEENGLRLEAIENVPYRFIDQILTGGPQQDRQIDNYCETVRNLGRAGIGTLGYHFAPNLVWRTSTSRPGRGGAGVSAFDLEQARQAPPTHKRMIDESELWGHYAKFITRVLPVAEEAGVLLSLHPDDPPVPTLGGVDRIMNSIAGYEKAFAIGNSPNHGMTFCVGTWGQMGGEIIYDALGKFLREKRVFYLHFRNIDGAVPTFSECFIDEGDVDVTRIVQILQSNSYDGFVIDDHVPQMVHDTPWGHRGRAFSTGFLKGLIRGMGADIAYPVGSVASSGRQESLHPRP
ncbi:mannonate dehydratase [Microvirga antarctica]|uniref:mannonate dehydratase n=1 Tax=Microvirga antarctica TaxID=2819233 RepID=UPI001B30CE60|nr:mannonate dehydratase [Microvirga antarctica]